MIDKLVKRARIDGGMSQQMVADLADVPRSQLQILEKGGNVTRETLEKVLGALGMSLAVVSRDDIEAMRRAMRELDAVLGRLAVQVAPTAVANAHRLLEMTRELEEIVRATSGAAAAEPLAALSKQATEHVGEAEAAARRTKRGRRRR